MPTANMPAAEVEITYALVTEMLRAQHPDLANLSLTLMANGWDNVMYRLGDDYIVRLPRRALAAPLIEFELEWLPGLAARLPVAIPAPIRRGAPTADYPWTWSICPFIAGHTAASAGDPVSSAGDPEADRRVARSLGEFLCALHTPAPPNAPANPYRGGPLSDRDSTTRQRIAQLADVIDDAATLAVWETLVATPPWTGPPLWLHGDLHPANILIRDGELCGVIDFGDITAGDPACDLSAGWIMFDEPSRSVFRQAAGTVDDYTWVRARGWALSLSLAYLESSADAAHMAAIGHSALRRALEPSES